MTVQNLLGFLNMSETVLIGVLFSVIQAAFWLWVRSSMAKVDSLAKKDEQIVSDLNLLKLNIANNYVKQQQLDQHMDRFDKSLDEIKKMLEKLSDRQSSN